MVARLPGPRLVSFHHDDLGGLAWKRSGMLRGHAVPSCAARCPGRLAPGAQPVRGRSSHPIELDSVSQVANAVLWMNAVDLFHVKRHFRRRITMTVVGDASKSTPHNTTCWSTPPSRPIASRCSSSSCAPRRPFSANRCPPGFRSGKHHAAKRSSGATARAVTQATGATRRMTARSSARPRTTLTRPANANAATASLRNVTRRAMGSTRSMRRSGRAQARTMPGSPAPDPMSTTRAARGSNSLTTAQFNRCRSQIRDASCGPSSPRSTPDDVSNSA